MSIQQRDRFRAFLPWLASLAALTASACGDDGGGTGDAGEDTTGVTSTEAEPTTSPLPTTTGEPTTGEVETETAATADTAADTTDGDTEPTACNAGRWQAPDFEANAAAALALRGQLDMLVGDALMRGAETGMVEVADIALLTDAWEAGDPSLADAVHPGFAPLVQGSFEEFMEILAAGEQDLMNPELTAWTPGEAGGIWGDADRGINEGGIEVRQIVDKGAFTGGVMYAYAVSLTTGEIDAATIDAIAAAWGTNDALDPEVSVTDSANYSFQMGFHAQMAATLTAAKTFAEDPACTAERDEAIVSFFRLWEQSMMARLVFYCNRAAGKLLTATDQTLFADVLHDLGEGLGVSLGFHGMPDPSEGPLSGAARTITDAELELVAEALGMDLGALGASTTGLFVESLPAYEAAVEAVEGVVMDVYDVDAATLQTYRMPTPG